MNYIFHSERNFTQFRCLPMIFWSVTDMSSNGLSYFVRRSAVFVIKLCLPDQEAWRISLGFLGCPLECVCSLLLSILTFSFVEVLAFWISLARQDPAYQVGYSGSWKSSGCSHLHLTSSLLSTLPCSWTCEWRGFFTSRGESLVSRCSIPSFGPSWWY